MLETMNKKNVLFRVDASVAIGSGHLMRCLTLAERLRVDGNEVAFVCSDLPGALFELLDSKEIRFEKISQMSNSSQKIDALMTIDAAHQLFPDGVDWLVVDHYELDAEWERLIRTIADNVFVIDDLANRAHDCDLLLDQNYYINLESRYNGLLPDSCSKLLGPSFVLLRDEFDTQKRTLRERDGSIKRILVFFGGSDHTNQTQRVLDALNLLQLKDIEIDVVVGISNPHLESIKTYCAQSSALNFYCQVSNMAELISKADLAIGAGGSVMWERCFLGLPSITVVFAKNQERTTEDLSSTGAIKYLGWADKIEVKDYAESIMYFLSHPEHVKNMSNCALSIVLSSQVSLVQEIKRINSKLEKIEIKRSETQREMF
jgi:UDP-2,4-diacetamido-2,4,6-trideoxy-beta-L-altropyranose hydrolase